MIFLKKVGKNEIKKINVFVVHGHKFILQTKNKQKKEQIQFAKLGGWKFVVSMRVTNGFRFSICTMCGMLYMWPKFTLLHFSLIHLLIYLQNYQTFITFMT